MEPKILNIYFKSDFIPLYSLRNFLSAFHSTRFDLDLVVLVAKRDQSEMIYMCIYIYFYFKLDLYAVLFCWIPLKIIVWSLATYLLFYCCKLKIWEQTLTETSQLQFSYNSNSWTPVLWGYYIGHKNHEILNSQTRGSHKPVSLACSFSEK
jgi:hypothetical protein